MKKIILVGALLTSLAGFAEEKTMIITPYGPGAIITDIDDCDIQDDINVEFKFDERPGSHYYASVDRDLCEDLASAYGSTKYSSSGGFASVGARPLENNFTLYIGQGVLKGFRHEAVQGLPGEIVIKKD